MEKITSGIEGFDKLLFGGFPKGRAYLIAGEPGTGKTIFCLQYLLAGAKLGQKGVYISIDEKPEQVIADAASLGWDLNSYLKVGLLQIIDVSNYFSTSKIGENGINIEHIVNDILGYVKKSGASRLAIDPIAPLVFAENKIPEVAEYIRKLIFAIEENEFCTTLLTSYVPVGSITFSQHGIEEFVASGIVLLKLGKVDNKFIRTIWVKKMRGTRIDLSEVSFEILPRRGIILRQPI
ncbi:MAG: ATPase domain-containing protein [Candidatus Margulisiibacteriota bacterium]|jgi:circadian clock protein KaiC